MTRFFVAGSNISGGAAVLAGEDAEHVKVLRMKVGDTLVLCDGAGRDYHCRLTKVGEDGVYVNADDDMPSAAEPSLRCVVCAAMPKGDKAETIVQKCVEAGAAEIVFFFSERCVARPKDRALERRIERLCRVAKEAAKQSGRGIIPPVRVVADLAGAISEALKTDLPLVMYETGERVTLRSALRAAGEFSSCAVITGPEGGFEAFEIELCEIAGLLACSMGPRILRCETAPLVALTAAMYETGNLE